VQAMASFSPPDPGWVMHRPHHADSLVPVIAAHWQ
jgi:hypothetical protein